MAPRTLHMCVVSALIFATPTVAQQNCQSRETIVEKLAESYDEHLIGRGLQGETRLFEVFMSDKGESWTILQSYPSGLSCIMAAGTHWNQQSPMAFLGIES